MENRNILVPHFSARVYYQQVKKNASVKGMRSLYRKYIDVRSSWTLFSSIKKEYTLT